MDTEFCTHLEKYELRFEDARDAYLDCLVLIDEVLASGPQEHSVPRVQAALDIWERRTRDLRGQFVRLTEVGEILLPEEGSNEQPVCAHCGAVVPRLEFPEFTFDEEGTFLYRGNPLREPELATT